MNSFNVWIFGISLINEGFWRNVFLKTKHLRVFQVICPRIENVKSKCGFTHLLLVFDALNIGQLIIGLFPSEDKWTAHGLLSINVKFSEQLMHSIISKLSQNKYFQLIRFKQPRRPGSGKNLHKLSFDTATIHSFIRLCTLFNYISFSNEGITCFL